MAQNQEYYHDNSKYTKHLEEQPTISYAKYLDLIEQFTEPSDVIVDIGCGAGQVLEQAKLAKRHIIGLDISKTSIKSCLNKGLEARLYNGSSFPFDNESVDFIGSYNVIEHVDDVDLFLKESDRALVDGGYLCIICPNFLSITNNYHHHTSGIVQKFKNLITYFKKSLSYNYSFDKMSVIVRDDFHVDDDACNIMNPIDIEKWLKLHNYKITYSSCKSVYGGITKYFDVPFVRNFFGSVCVIAIKKV